MTRSPEVDTIRGLALFGICVVNVPFLAQPVASMVPPQAGVDLVVWMALQMLFEGKFFVLFSFIFGWGFAVQIASAERAGVSPSWRFLRRLFGLFLIGIAHATLVFFGDILVLYALLGLPLLVLRHASSRQLLTIAAAAIVFAAVILFLLALSSGQMADSFLVSKGVGYPGSFADGLRQRVTDWPDAFVFIVMFNGPLAFAAFCTGLAAAKIGFLEVGNPVYAAVRRRLPLLIMVALPLNLFYTLASSDLLGSSYLTGAAFALLAVAGPMLGAVYLIGAIELARWGRFQGATVAAGRMSLTVYLLEGIIAGLIFNGYGLRLYGTVGPLACFGIAVAVYLATHSLAALWLNHFRQGPLEIVLRWITKGRSEQSAVTLY